MPREIKTTIAVDGEQAFKRAINEANTSMRNLGTQLTLAQAQFKKDGDAMKLMESRSKTLAAEIGQQENIVKALEKAVEDSSKAYGENSEKTEKWEAELNRAKAKLVSLQSELTLNDQGLDRNGKAFDESSQAAADYQATLQTIGKNVSFETVTSGIHNITGVIEGAIKKVFSFAKAIRETFADAGEWADALMTDATKYGMDVETLQAWQNAADFIDTDVNTIITARDKLGQKMKKGWKDGDINMWEMLGIDLKDAETGKWRDKMDVMWEVGETLMSMARIDGDDVRADAYAQEVFGKSWRELLPLFVAGRKEWEKTVAEQQVVSEERVKALGELDDANQALANSWDVTKYSFLAELAPVVTDVTEAVTEMLQAFNEWMDTDEGKQAMQELSEAIQELFSGLKDVSFKDAIDAVKGAIEGIKDALVWMDEHKNDVVTALEIIAGGFALLKVTELALNIGKIVSGFQTLWAGANNPLPSLPGTGTNGPVTTTGSPTTTGTDTTTAAAGGGLLSRILSSPVAKAIGGAGAFLWAMSPDNPLFAQSGSNDLFDANGNPTQEFWANGDYYMKDRLQALHDRYIGSLDVFTKAGGKESNFFDADCVSTGMSMQGGLDAAGPMVASHPEIKYWLCNGLFDDLGQAAASIFDQQGLTDTSAVCVFGGSALIQQWDAGQEDSFRFAVYTAQTLYAEPIIGGVVAFLNGWATPDNIWPSWIKWDDQGINGHTYSQLRLPTVPIEHDSYKQYLEWTDLYTHASAWPYDNDVTVKLDDFSPYVSEVPAEYKKP